MAHDGAAVVKVADLFDPEPETWGLAGVSGPGVERIAAAL
jgi:hypothetical protein